MSNVKTKKKMTLKQFWKELESLGRVLGGDCKKWVRHHHVDKNCYEGNHCLITAVCKKLTHKEYDPCNVCAAASDLGLDDDITDKIISAADNGYDADKRYVNKILNIYGLKKKVKKNV